MQHIQLSKITHYCLLSLILFHTLCFSNTLALADSVSNVATELLKNEEVSQDLPAEIDKAIRSQLSETTGIAPEELKVIEASKQTWPDGCLGLAQPDELCTQMLITGWRVVMSDGRQTWVYRTDNQGNTIRPELDAD